MGGDKHEKKRKTNVVRLSPTRRLRFSASHHEGEIAEAMATLWVLATRGGDGRTKTFREIQRAVREACDALQMLHPHPAGLGQFIGPVEIAQAREALRKRGVAV